MVPAQAPTQGPSLPHTHGVQRKKQTETERETERHTDTHTHPGRERQEHRDRNETEKDSQKERRPRHSKKGEGVTEDSERLSGPGTLRSTPRPEGLEPSSAEPSGRQQRPDGGLPETRTSPFSRQNQM